MRRRRAIEVFSISFLDLLSGALGAVIILYVAIPKQKTADVVVKENVVNEIMQKELRVTSEKLEKTQDELKDAKEMIERLQASLQIKMKDPNSSAEDYDVGFKFKGKNIVFLIDTSYSMLDEDRIGQVKAGVKMLLTSLSPLFKIDIVQFPYGDRAPFKSMWGAPKEMTGFYKKESFEFIYSLKPWGGTPTRDALSFVLKNYPNISDIVVLSDGAPTFHNSNKKDDIYDILKMAREENLHKVQISAIGVGSDFIKDKNSERYQFLHLLTEQGNGFFVGF